MDSNDISEFLVSRRAKLSLAQAGLPDFGGRRRVPGLRREEVALLAGMSAEYYKRLERGTATGVSEGGSTASAAPCSWMRRSTPTCATWCVRPTRAPTRSGADRPASRS